MPLESLLELVQTLSSRIDQHGPALRQSEALTRYALIDPLLRGLGWDTADPDMVIPEFRVPNNQIADYVLFNDGHPAMVVESKKLDEPLQSGKALDQGILYCAHTGSKHFVLTDGRQWEIYESSNTTPAISFDLKDNPAQACLNALALWQPSVETGHVFEAQTPVLPLSPNQPKPSQVLPTEITPQPEPVVPTINNGTAWYPLSESEFEPPPKSRPAEMSFPDSSTASIKTWWSMLVECTRWLVDGGYLRESNCPIKSPYAHDYYIVHTSPIHSTGNSFRRGHQVGSLHVEAISGMPSMRSASKARHVISAVGQDPAQFKVRLS